MTIRTSNNPVALDVRSLVVFRVCFGLYILYDIWMVRLSTSVSTLVSTIMAAVHGEAFSLPVDYNIGWYTSASASSSSYYVSNSSSSQASYLQEYDTPHQSPIHRIWFYRGSNTYQYALFIITSGMALAYMFGGLEEVTIVSSVKRIDAHPPQSHSPQYTTTEITITTRSILFKLCLWLLVTSYQNQNMYLHDGSDNYTRLLLLYSCFIPLVGTSQCNIHSRNIAITSTSILSISLQILCMYSGTVSRRTIDAWDTIPFSRNEWLPPTLSAVSNAICYNNFAVRNNFINRLICSNYMPSQFMTMGAMTIETCCPVLGFVMLLLIHRSRKHHEPKNVLRFQRLLWYASILPIATLHIGLLCSLRLPNWQIVAVIALILWIPSNVWNEMEYQKSRLMLSWNVLWHPNDGNHNSNIYKKTDGDRDPDVVLITSVHGDTDVNVRTEQRIHYTIVRSPSKILTAIQYFLLFHMIYNFCNERSILSKYDSGDIGEFLRISQYWVMYSTVGTTSHTTQITGTIHTDLSSSHPDSGNRTRITKKLDLLLFMSTGIMSDPGPHLATDTIEIPIDVSSSMIAAISHVSTHYPNVRWERALHTWSKDSFLFRSTNQSRKIQQQKERLKYFGAALCQLINNDLHRVPRARNNNNKSVQRSNALLQRHYRNLHWLLNRTDNNASAMSNNIQQRVLENFKVSEIEIRFQHLQLLSEQRMLRKESADDVVTIPCHLD